MSKFLKIISFILSLALLSSGLYLKYILKYGEDIFVIVHSLLIGFGVAFTGIMIIYFIVTAVFKKYFGKDDNKNDAEKMMIENSFDKASSTSFNIVCIVLFSLAISFSIMGYSQISAILNLVLFVGILANFILRIVYLKKYAGLKKEEKS